MNPAQPASFRGRETEVVALGSTWRVARFEIDILDDWTDWARKLLPNPVAVVKPEVRELAREEYDLIQRQDMDEQEKGRELHFLQSQQERLTRQALDDAESYLAFNAPRVQSLLNHPRGGARLLYLMLKKHHPNVDETTAFDIAQEIGPVEMQRVVAVTTGKSAPASKNAASPTATK